MSTLKEQWGREREKKRKRTSGRKTWIRVKALPRDSHLECISGKRERERERERERKREQLTVPNGTSLLPSSEHFQGEEIDE